MDLSGKVAIITGGRSGIGRAIADILAQKGAQIVIANRDEEQAQKAAAEIAAASGQLSLAVGVDVSSYESANAMVKTVLSELGRVDILVNNAGTTRDTLILRMREEDWDAVLDTNLKGSWNCSKAVIRPMMKQRFGRIINISSVSGLSGQAGQTNYSASKAGMIGLTKALAREVATRGITVNAIAPGFVPTALTADLPDDLKESMIEFIPMKRWGKPEEIAHAAAFFASEEASYITGQVLSVDGGMMMM